MSDNFIHLHRFLQTNREKPSQHQICVEWEFTSDRVSIQFKGDIFIDVDAQKGPHLTLLDHPDRFNFDYYSSFDCGYNDMTFDEKLNRLLIVVKSSKVGPYQIIFQP